MRLFLLILLLLPFSACMKTVSGEGEQVATQPVPISGKTIIDSSKITMEEQSPTDYEVVAEEGALQGPDRCLAAFVLSLAAFNSFRDSGIFPPVKPVEIALDLPVNRMLLRRLADAAAVLLLPKTCGAVGHTQEQKQAGVFMNFEHGAKPMPVAGEFALLLRRASPSAPGRYLVSIRDAVGETFNARSCPLSPQVAECLPLVFSGVKLPVTVTIVPEIPDRLLNVCSVLSNPLDLLIDDASCTFSTNKPGANVSLSMPLISL